nr:transposase [Candidatus Freyarchaeota archaeon]
MKQALLIKLAPSKEQYDTLLQVMHRFNDACNYIAEIAYERKCANKIALQKLAYYDTREKYKLSAQLTIRAIAKVAEAYKRDKTIKPTFKPRGAVVYDQRILSWRGLQAVSILTLKGRQVIPISIGEYQEARMDERVQGQADLIYRNNTFYLSITVDTPEPARFDPVGGVLGVDLGIVNLAVDSDGENHSGEKVDRIRERRAELRTNLQKRGTKSAKRHLQKLSGREKRFHRDVNHCVSKRLVAKAKDTGRAVALEDLNGIIRQSQVTVRKAQRSRHHSWAFRQLRSFIEYKAALSGVPVILVNPRGTSHTCPVCGHNERGNRPSRNEFRCVRCGFAGPADHVAAINIAVRAAIVNQPIVACGEAEAIITISGTEAEHSYKLISFMNE